MSKKILGLVLALLLVVGVCVSVASCEDDVEEVGGGDAFEELE